MRPNQTSKLPQTKVFKYRSAITGRFISRREAIRNPDTTVQEVFQRLNSTLMPRQTVVPRTSR